MEDFGDLKFYSFVNSIYLASTFLMNEWYDLFVATAGAAAALTGLLFVGVSINLERILSFHKLADRALNSLILLLTILIVSIIFLVPGQSLLYLGIEVLIITIIAIIIIFRTDYSILIYNNEYRREKLSNLIFDQLSILPFVIGGMMLTFSNERGVFLIVLALIFCFIKSVSDAWVLLIEINR